MGDLVFISHSSLDSDLVDRIVVHLEANGVTCWSSSRDIPPGSDWAESIYNAISSSRAIILLFSRHSNSSWQVRNELDIATNLKVPIIPVRLDSTEISKGLRYFTSSHQWLDESGSTEDRLLAGILSAATAVVHCLERQPGRSRRRLGRSAGRHIAVAGSALVLPALVVLAIAGGRKSGVPESRFGLTAGGTDSWDFATDVEIEQNGGFYVSGTWDWGFWSDAWVARFDTEGRLLWSWTDSLAGECDPLMVPADDGGVIVGYGQYADFDHTGFWVEATRLDSIGSTEWSNILRIDWPGAAQPEFGSMEIGPDGFVYLAFTLRSRDRGAGAAIHIVDLDPEDGEMRWTELPGFNEACCYLPDSVGGFFCVARESESRAIGVSYIPADDQDAVHRIVIGDSRTQADCAALTAGGDLLLCLTSNSYVEGNGDLEIRRITPGLVIDWERTYGGALWDCASDIAALADGSILVGGSSNSFGDGSADCWLLFLDEEGRLENESVVDLGGDDFVSSLAALPGGGLLAVGWIRRDGDPDAWIADFSDDGSCSEDIRMGIEISSEDWQSGFLDQDIWLMGRNRNYSPTILVDSLTGDASIDLNCVPLVCREGFPASPGIRLSAEIEISDTPSASGSNFISIGLTSVDADSYLQDPASAPMADIRWNYTARAGAPYCSIHARCSLGDSLLERVESDSEWVVRSEEVPFSIELCTATVRFHVGGRLFMEAPIPGGLPDSLRIVLNGSSDSSPHYLDDILLFRGRW